MTSGNVIVACVRTGDRHPFECVTKLRNMVARHSPYRVVCLTDQPERCEGVAFIDVGELNLAGDWAKMILFAPEWRSRSQVVYFDLDTVIVGDITPLAGVPGEFSVLRTRLPPAGCSYDISVMVIGSGQCEFVWSYFDERRDWIMARCGRYGVQKAIEDLYPVPTYIQPFVPTGFVIDGRRLPDRQPEQVSVISFGASAGIKPHNCQIPWVRAAWF